MVDVVARTAEQVFIPFTVGGGIRTVDDARRMLRAGADKVSLNTAAVDRPELDRRGRRRSSAPSASSWRSTPGAATPTTRRPAGTSFTHGGRTPTELDAVEWAVRGGAARARARSCSRRWTATARGTGSTSSSPRAVSDAVGVPVIASGGVGTLEHLADGVIEGGADAVLAASIFHFGEHTVAEAKAVMAARGITVRPATPGR